MNAIEPLAVEASRTCQCSSVLTRTIRRDIPARFTTAGAVIWRTVLGMDSTDPIPLEHYLDTVTWDLSELEKVYGPPPGTLYEIEFMTTPGPRSLRKNLGPFNTLDLNTAPVRFIGDQSVYDQGCYIYNLHVTPEGSTDRLQVTIDPQIDNIAPPPPPPTGNPEFPHPEDWRRAEH